MNKKANLIYIATNQGLFKYNLMNDLQGKEVDEKEEEAEYEVKKFKVKNEVIKILSQYKGDFIECTAMVFNEITSTCYIGATNGCIYTFNTITYKVLYSSFSLPLSLLIEFNLFF